jgi:hypothetical protein
LVKGLAFSLLFCAAAAELALKWKLSFPASRIWERWVAVEIDHFEREIEAFYRRSRFFTVA